MQTMQQNEIKSCFYQGGAWVSDKMACLASCHFITFMAMAVNYTPLQTVSQHLASTTFSA